MTQYVALPFNKKLNLLRQHSFGCDWPNLEQEHWCLHCGQKFSGHMVRVWQDAQGSLWLECGTPGCDGSPIDWAPFPWWESTREASKKKRKKTSARPRRRKGRPETPPDDDVPF